MTEPFNRIQTIREQKSFFRSYEYVYIERVFADAKEKHGLCYTLRKGFALVRNWVRLKFVAMNPKKLAMWCGPNMPLFLPFAIIIS